MTRHDFSHYRLIEFSKEVENSVPVHKYEDLCIYTTGSYGRGEAFIESDIDLFFLHTNNETNFSRIDKIILDASLIQIARKMKFPEFSGDGEYLEIHSMKSLHNELGSREDDYRNFFTARMLLLLESQCIFNSELYDKLIDETISRYYTDFHSHSENFRPLFIVNDVIRFWKTMCINYEHSRYRKFSSNLSEEDKLKKKAEALIKNLKLKFSRKLTCYSFLLSVVCDERNILGPEDIRDIIDLTPMQRVEALIGKVEIKENVNNMIIIYNEYLDIIQQPRKELIDWILDETNKKNIFKMALEFDKIIYSILDDKKYNSKLLYLLL